MQYGANEARTQHTQPPEHHTPLDSRRTARRTPRDGGSPAPLRTTRAVSADASCTVRWCMARRRRARPSDACPDHLGTLSPEHWQGLRQQHARLDHRASSTTALLAYAAAGVLPSAQPLLRSRSDPARVRPPSPLPPASAKLTCAVCRIAAHELALAAAIAQRCLPQPAAAALLASVPAVLCEHLGALGCSWATRRCAYTRTSFAAAL